MAATQGADLLTGSADPDALDGLDGPDTIHAGAGADVLSGGGGADRINGGADDDVLYGFGAADIDPQSGVIAATRITSGLARPVYATAPPNDADHLFIVQQHSADIRLLDLTTNTLASTPFLHFAPTELSRGGEQGLLGLAFHPDYADNGKFYINITNLQGDQEIREYIRASTNPNAADPSSGKLVLTIPHGFGAHNGGWIGFGPDGYLYITAGDGGGLGLDPNNNAQNIDSLRGKILRIDVDGDAFPGDPNRNYAIPPDNPFAAQVGADEVWATGLRNPWRMSFDALTGDVYIGDVGASQCEEIDYLRADAPPGANFGWRVLEGTLTLPGNPPGNPSPNDPSLIAPLLEYRHVGAPDGGFSVTGGYVYHGPGGAQGVYFFADFVSAQIWSARVVDGAPVDFINRTPQIVADSGVVDQIASFGVDGSGRLYTIGLDGEIFRLAPSAGAADGADILHGDDGADTIRGGTGADQLYGDAGADALFGGRDADNLFGGAGADQLDGGAGFDYARYDDANYGNVTASLGDASLNTGAAAGDAFVGIEGLVLGVGHDVGYGDNAANHLYGLAGNDRLYGQYGADFLHGGPGDDQLGGGAGDDRLTGDAGRDIFIFRAGYGQDRILDFQGGTGLLDQIDMRGLFSTFAQALAASRQVGADLVITTNAATVLTIENFYRGNFAADDVLL